ncbi:MAG: PA3496 family putative envelope integrity protein [Gammaproteobacteria bacterium]
MSMSKSSGIEEFLRNSDDAGTDQVYERGAPGRKRDHKPVKPQNASQAWRTLEDHLNERRLKRKLKEIYEDD